MQGRFLCADLLVKVSASCEGIVIDADGASGERKIVRVTKPTNVLPLHVVDPRALADNYVYGHAVQSYVSR